MQKASEIVWNLLNYYFNKNTKMIYNFRKNELHYSLLMNQEIENNKYNHNSSNFSYLKNGKHIHLDMELSKRIAQRNQILKKTSSKDLIAYSPLSYTYHLIKLTKGRFSVINIKRQLGMILTQKMPNDFKIYWLLIHNPLSDAKFGKLVNMTGSQVTKYRTGSSKVGNMTLNHASKICMVYQYIIQNQLIKSHHPLVTREDIVKSFIDVSTRLNGKL